MTKSSILASLFAEGLYTACSIPDPCRTTSENLPTEKQADPDGPFPQGEPGLKHSELMPHPKAAQQRGAPLIDTQFSISTLNRARDTGKALLERTQPRLEI